MDQFVTPAPAPGAAPGPVAPSIEPGPQPHSNIQARPRAADLLARYLDVRRRTEAYAAHLTPEDQVIQSMPDASPAKWHRAHTTWFWEQFVLVPHAPGYCRFDPDFNYLFNSYYDTIGDRHPRVARGLVTRPDAAHVAAYRAEIDAAMTALIADSSDATGIADLLALGFAHEEQHQELLLTDMLHGFAQNVLTWRHGQNAVIPGWRAPPPATAPGASRFLPAPGGLVSIGADGAQFAFDNEGPRHLVHLAPYALSDTLVRNRDWLAFIEDGGYRNPLLWMSDGWSTCLEEGWDAPLYWRIEAGVRVEYGFGGVVELDPDAPVRHISWYEADAYARWAGARLPTEFEIEAMSDRLPDLFGVAWQWTNSAYLAYPGFRPDAGAIGEYNGKFMINQMVLRGSSSATSPHHARATYRNFFPPEKRWQVTGLRLARDA